MYFFPVQFHPPKAEVERHRSNQIFESTPSEMPTQKPNDSLECCGRPSWVSRISKTSSYSYVRTGATEGEPRARQRSRNGLLVLRKTTSAMPQASVVRIVSVRPRMTAEL